jgi:large subunit ribosomal protein L24
MSPHGLVSSLAALRSAPHAHIDEANALVASTPHTRTHQTLNAFTDPTPSPPVCPPPFRCVPDDSQKKKWEKQELNQNGNPVRVPMHVKTNDKVVVICGADKGKVTSVVEVFTKSGTILCKDVNIKTKHVKPKGEGETGQIIQKEWPIHHSNVMHWSETKQVRSRVGHKMVDGKKVRVLKKTDEVLAN